MILRRHFRGNDEQIRMDIFSHPSAGTIAISGVVFDKTVAINSRACALIGAGLLRYRVVFKGYGAALCLESGNASGDVFKDITKSLVIEY